MMRLLPTNLCQPPRRQLRLPKRRHHRLIKTSRNNRQQHEQRAQPKRSNDPPVEHLDPPRIIQKHQIPVQRRRVGRIRITFFHSSSGDRSSPHIHRRNERPVVARPYFSRFVAVPLRPGLRRERAEMTVVAAPFFCYGGDGGGFYADAGDGPNGAAYYAEPEEDDEAGTVGFFGDVPVGAGHVGVGHEEEDTLLVGVSWKSVRWGDF